MKVALISLSNAGARIAARLACAQEGDSPIFGVSCGDDERKSGQSPGLSAPDRRQSCAVFLHSSVTELPQAERFEHIADLTAELFAHFQGLVYIAPAGLVVRAVAPCLKHKTTDPGIVVVDVGGRWAVSLVGGHEGGANRLALAVANILGAEPVITTTTEAAKDLIVGVGCRRGTAAETILAAIHAALATAGCQLAQVRLLASADLKADEAGLLQAATQLGVPLRLIAADEIASTIRVFEASPLVQEKVNLPAVAEPAALLAGRRTRLILPKTKANGVTVAIARENCMPSG